MWQQDFIQLLKTTFEKAREKNPKYSLRAFAKKAGVSSGALSSLFRGAIDWKLSKKRARRILDALNLEPEDRNRMLALMGEAPDRPVAQLPADDYELMTDWTFAPIWITFDLPPEFRRPELIAQRLQIDVAKVESVIAELRRRGLLVVGEDGHLHRPANFMMTSDGIPSEAIRRFHASSLEIASVHAPPLPVSDRDLRSLTFVGSKENLETLRTEIAALVQRAGALMDAGPKNENVYRLTVALFPLDFRDPQEVRP